MNIKDLEGIVQLGHRMTVSEVELNDEYRIKLRQDEIRFSLLASVQDYVVLEIEDTQYGRSVNSTLCVVSDLSALLKSVRDLVDNTYDTAFNRGVEYGKNAL